MSTDENKSLLAILGQDEDKDTIPNRIQFVKTLLKNNSLEPIINFDNTDTEYFMNRSREEDDSGESYDTRVALKKQIFDITDIINNIGGTLKYIKSGTTGHTFKGECLDENGNPLYEYAVKVVAYSIKDKYGDMYDTRRPENAELLMIKLLSYFIVKKKTPHIVLPIGTFDTDITHFTDLIERGYIKKTNEKYQEFVDRYNAGEYYDQVSILINEWANRGDFLDFIKKNYRKFSRTHWKVFFFQLISTLAVIQSKFSSFRHNDLKANNILVTKISKNVNDFTYKVNGNLYKVPNIGYQLKLWDFDFACIPGIVDNKKVTISNTWSRGINVGPTQNRYYDIHYFFNTLIKRGFFPELLTDYRVPQETKDFVNSIVPPEYQSGSSVSKKGRILHNIEYTTPGDILKTNPYFDEFRKNQKIRSFKSLTKEGSKGKNKMIDNFLKGGDKIERAIAVSDRLNRRTKSSSKTKSPSKIKRRNKRTKTKSKSKKEGSKERKTRKTRTKDKKSSSHGKNDEKTVNKKTTKKSTITKETKEDPDNKQTQKKTIRVGSKSKAKVKKSSSSADRKKKINNTTNNSGKNVENNVEKKISTQRRTRATRKRDNIGDIDIEQLLKGI